MSYAAIKNTSDGDPAVAGLELGNVYDRNPGYWRRVAEGADGFPYELDRVGITRGMADTMANEFALFRKLLINGINWKEPGPGTRLSVVLSPARRVSTVLQPDRPTMQLPNETPIRHTTAGQSVSPHGIDESVEMRRIVAADAADARAHELAMTEAAEKARASEREGTNAQLRMKHEEHESAAHRRAEAERQEAVLAADREERATVADGKRRDVEAAVRIAELGRETAALNASAAADALNASAAQFDASGSSSHAGSRVNRSVRTVDGRAEKLAELALTAADKQARELDTDAPGVAIKNKWGAGAGPRLAHRGELLLKIDHDTGDPRPGCPAL